ncbi:hypothetical protein [Arthrobacter sp.]|uniref:hypothetical protein n=1 Tax=Arthrobacter sp. TaxID=1667 RepID=UPI003A927F7E
MDADDRDDGDDRDIELISDGDGLAVIGDPAAVDRFLTAEGLASRDLGLHRLKPALRTGTGIAQAGVDVASQSGRWVKLTRKSAEQMKAYGLMKGSNSTVSRAIVTDQGKIKGIVEFARRPGSMVANPALLAGAAGIMAQLAMQQSMDEITNYLAAIDEKVDDILRAQQDAVLADMIGVGAAIEEALVVRGQVGGVSEVTWSKVQATSTTILRTQAYALRQLESLAEKVQRKTSMGDLAKATRLVESPVREWLAVLARCFQLQDALTILELDRVLAVAPDEVEEHRVGLQAARRNRLALMSRGTESLLARMEKAIGTANEKVLLHPRSSRAVVVSSNHVVADVVEFHEGLGIERDQGALPARGWTNALAEVRDRALETGADGMDAARQIGSEALGRAKSVTSKVSTRWGAGSLRHGKPEEPDADD